MDVGILLVGDELLAGHTRDANGQYLTARLTGLGHRVIGIRVAPDEAAAIKRDLLGLLELAPYVIVTGGLGPTHDDRTTDALAQALHLSTMVDESAFAALARRHERRYAGNFPAHVQTAGRKMCTIPKGATALPNTKGSAIGYAIPRPPGMVIVLPGVPTEMQAMFEQEVAAKLVPRLAALHLEEITLRLAEAEFSSGLSRLARDNPRVSIGSYPKWGSEEVTIRIRGERDEVLFVRNAIEAAYKEYVVIRGVERESG